MTLCIPENEPYPDENDISSGWRRANISEVGLEPSVQPQRVASLDPWYRLVCQPDIR